MDQSKDTTIHEKGKTFLKQTDRNYKESFASPE